MTRRGSLRLGTVGSIEIYVNITWLAVFALLIYWLRVGYVAGHDGDIDGALAWLVSAAGALTLFGSVLAHELSHSLIAVQNGLPIKKITLFIFGGIAHMESEPRSPGVEFKMAIAGPVMSILIATAAGLVRFWLLAGSPNGVAALIAEYAFYGNTVLACFNLVPGFPLDGGRVLRAFLWRVTRNYVRSTVIAATVGRIFGLGLVFVGVAAAIAYRMPALLWPALIGTFIERLATLSSVRVKRMHGEKRIAMAAGFAPLSATPLPVFARGSRPPSRGEERKQEQPEDREV